MIMESNQELIISCENKAKEWLSSSFNEETRKEVQAMLDNSDKTELIDSFYKDLEFGYRRIAWYHGEQALIE